VTSTYAGARKRRQAPISIAERHLPLKMPLRLSAFRPASAGCLQIRHFFEHNY